MILLAPAPLSRLRSRLPSLAAVLAAASLASACTTVDGDGEDDEGSLEQSLVQEGTPQAAAILAIANQQTFQVLDVDVALDSRAATSIVNHRPFATIAALDAAPYIGPKAFDLLLAYAVAQGQVEPGGNTVVYGYEEGSRNARSILKIANLLTLQQLDGDVGLDHRAAEGIAAVRPLHTLTELAAVSYVGQTAFNDLLAYAVGHGLESMWPLPPLAGIGDAPIIVVPGADIPSQYVDATKSYVARRRIARLGEAGALDSIARSVAERVDGVLGNQPADGFIDLRELVTFEQPEFLNLLYPDERARFPLLYQRLEVATTARVDLRFSDLPALTLETYLAPPAGLVIPAQITITTLPSQRQQAASRLQLIFNSDGNAATISLADLDGVDDNPDIFTPQELDDFDAIRAIFQERATSNPTARIRIPTPGTFTEQKAIGALTATRTSTVAVIENRRRRYDSWSGSYYWTGDLAVTRTLAFTMSAPTTAYAILVDEATSQERVVAFPNSYVVAPAGNYIVELWNNGQRTAAGRVTLSELQGSTAPVATLPIDDFFDTTIETLGGQPLYRNVYSTTANQNGFQYEATWRFAVQAASNPPNTNTSALSETATPATTLPVGRYTIEVTGVGPVSLDLYPTGAVWSGLGSSTATRLRFGMISTERVLTGSLIIGNSGYVVTFRPSANELRVATTGGAAILNRTLTALDRVQ